MTMSSSPSGRPRQSLLSYAALMLARFCLSMWVGAAVLFVVNGVHIVLSHQFPSETIDRLVPIRFGNYYGFGFTLVTLGLVGGVIAAGNFSKTRVGLYTLVLVASLVLMGIDYVYIYKPLLAMVTPPGQPRPQAFGPMHEWSERINTLHVGLVAVGALTLCWPSATCWNRRGETCSRMSEQAADEQTHQASC